MNDKKSLTIRADAVILAKCKAISKKCRRSLNSQIEYFLEQSIIQFEKENGEIEVSPDDIYS